MYKEYSVFMEIILLENVANNSTLIYNDSEQFTL